MGFKALTLVAVWLLSAGSSALAQSAAADCAAAHSQCIAGCAAGGVLGLLRGAERSLALSQCRSACAEERRQCDARTRPIPPAPAAAPHASVTPRVDNAAVEAGDRVDTEGRDRCLRLVPARKAQRDMMVNRCRDLVVVRLARGDAGVCGRVPVMPEDGYRASARPVLAVCQANPGSQWPKSHPDDDCSSCPTGWQAAKPSQAQVQAHGDVQTLGAALPPPTPQTAMVLPPGQTAPPTRSPGAAEPVRTAAAPSALAPSEASECLRLERSRGGSHLFRNHCPATVHLLMKRPAPDVGNCALHDVVEQERYQYKEPQQSGVPVALCDGVNANFSSSQWTRCECPKPARPVALPADLVRVAGAPAVEQARAEASASLRREGAARAEETRAARADALTRGPSACLSVGPYPGVAVGGLLMAKNACAQEAMLLMRRHGESSDGCQRVIVPPGGGHPIEPAKTDVHALCEFPGSTAPRGATRGPCRCPGSAQSVEAGPFPNVR